MRNLIVTTLLGICLTAPVLAQHDCVSDFGCPEGQLCRGDEHRTVCVTATCTDSYSPVCGMDGNTYGNACLAALHRKGTLYVGVCGRCGSSLSHSCSSFEFCDLDSGSCDAASAEGNCQPAPAACPPGGEPVCGCDGQTYGNDCLRRMARVSLASAGPCLVKPATALPAPPAKGRTVTAPPAPPAKGRTVNAPPAPPVEPPPVTVPSAQAWASPELEEQRLGNSSRLPGKECLSNEDCEEDHYCAKAIRDCAGSGTCRPRGTSPDGCGPKQMVCGCDGVTYTNACWAAAAGQSLRCTDECAKCLKP